MCVCVLQHESEILPFPNSEKSFSLPDDIIQEVKEGEGVISVRMIMRRSLSVDYPQFLAVI